MPQDLYKIIDDDNSHEVTWEEFKDFFEKKKKAAARAKSREKKKKKAKAADSDSDEESARTSKGYGQLRRKTKKTTFSPTNAAGTPKTPPQQTPGGSKRHKFFDELGKKKNKKKKGPKDDHWDGTPQDMFGWHGERKEMLREDDRLMKLRKEVPYTGLNCDFGGKRYVNERCVKCTVGFAHVKLMPDDLLMCDRCVLDRFWETRSFCR